MMTQAQFDNDPALTAKAMTLLTEAANDSDPAFDEWLDQRAMEFAIERGDFYV